MAPGGDDRSGAGVDVEAYYRRYAPMVLRRCRQLLRDEERAIDAMQDVFVSLLRAGPGLRPDRPVSLLLRIATRVSLNQLRSDRRHPVDADDERLHAIASAEEPERRSIARFVLGELLGREQESTRVMAVMHLLDGLTLEEIGREVGLSAAAVRKRLRGLKLRVGERMAREGAPEETP